MIELLFIDSIPTNLNQLTQYQNTLKLESFVSQKSQTLYLFFLSFLDKYLEISEHF